MLTLGMGKSLWNGPCIPLGDEKIFLVKNRFDFKHTVCSNNYEFQIEMESDKNVKTLRWIEDHASILDDDYENRVPKVQFQKNVKVKPYKPSAKPSSLGKKHSIVQDIDNEYDIQPRHSHGSNQSNESCEEQLENDHYSLRYVSDIGDDSRILVTFLIQYVTNIEQLSLSTFVTAASVYKSYDLKSDLSKRRGTAFPDELKNQLDFDGTGYVKGSLDPSHFILEINVG